MSKMKKNRKGQVVLIGLLFAFMLVTMFSMLAEPLIEFVALGVNGTSAAVNADIIATAMNLIPVFFVFVILISVVALITGRTAG